MRNGFTQLEVLVALVVLEISVLGVLGTLRLASDTQQRAEALEHAVARVEGVLDSLYGGAAPGGGSAAFSGGLVRWVIDDAGVIELDAVSEGQSVLLQLRTSVVLR